MKKNISFTLVELLIVISVIIIMFSMLLPALKQTKNTAQQISCKNNLKQIGSAAMMYFTDYSEWLPFAYVTGGDKDGYCDRSVSAWYVCYTPYLNLPYYSYCGLGLNASGLSKPCIFTCPSQSFIYPATQPVSYAMLMNLASGAPVICASPLTNRPNLKDIKNLSKKLFFIDSTYPYFVKVGKIDDDTGGQPNGFFSFRHNLGSNILFFDGHCSWDKKLALIAAKNEYKGLFYPFNE